MYNFWSDSAVLFFYFVRLSERADDSIHSYVAENTSVSAKDFTFSDTERAIARYFKMIFDAHNEYDEIYFRTCGKNKGYGTYDYGCYE